MISRDFKFQQLCRVRVTDNPSSLPQNRSSLIAATSKYGLTFVAVLKGFKVLRTSDFVAYDERHASDRLNHTITDFPVLADVNVGYDITHVQLSADDQTLAVAITRPEHAVVYLYDVGNFVVQPCSSKIPASNKSPPSTVRQRFGELMLHLEISLLKLCGGTGAVQASHMIVGEGNQRLNDLSWNPVDPNLLIICYCTGRLDVYVKKDRKASLPTARAKCVCWSPKGKQLVIGRDDGSLVQYDPDLNEKRKWACPSILTAPSEAIDIVWLSTYTFLVAYIAHGVDCAEQPSAVMINGLKDGPATFVNFEDMCFGNGEERERKYYFNFVQKWDMVLAASSNAGEISLVGKHLDNKTTWERWNLDDSARAECPLTDDYGDSYPMGLAVDYSSQRPIPLGDEKIHPPSPLMLILSTEGLILPYHMMYMHQSAPAICAPAQTLQATATRQPTGVPTAPASQQNVGKNLFGSGSTQPPSFGGTPTAKTGVSSPFSFAGSTGVPASSDVGAIPKFGAGLNLTGSTTQSGSASSFSFATGTGVPAAKSDQSESKPPLSAGFGSTAFAGSTNRSGASAGFSVTPSFGASTTAVGSFSFATSTTGSTGFSTKNPIATDAIGNAAEASSAASSSTPGFTFAAKLTEPGSQTSGLNFKPATTSKTPTPLFGQSSQSPASTPTFGESAPKTTTTMAAPPAFPAFGKTAAAAVTAVSSAPSGGFVSTAASSKPVPSFTGQSSAFTGMPSAAAGRPIPKSDSQSSDLGQPGSFVAKSPSQAPPPPAAGAGARPQSPKFAPPPAYPSSAPQYPSDAPEYHSDTQEGRQDTGETTDEVDEQFSKSILDEIEHFGKELMDFKNKGKRRQFIVGTKDDMKRLKQQTQEVENFCKEIKTTVQEQNKEVQDQRALCLDMFSMAEECRHRQHMNTDPKYLHLLKSRALDPGSSEKLQQLQLQYQVLDQGLKDVDLILDTQWEDYQSRKKNRTNRVQNPTNDAVYRVVKSNSNLITAQRNKLKELEEWLKQLKLYNRTSAWNNTTSSFSSGDTTELSNLADTLLSGNPVESRNDSSEKEEKMVNRDRLERLREHLCRRNVSVVRSTKPGNLSVLKIPDSQLARPVFKNSQQQLSDLEGVPRNAGGFVGMNRRSSPAPSKNRVAPTQTDAQTVLAQNEKNKQEKVKDKTDKDGIIEGFFKKITKGTEKLKQHLPSKTQTVKPGMTSTQGVGLNLKQPTQQVPQNEAIPKTIQTAMFPAPQEGPGPQPKVLTKVKEINGIKLEDITPSGSENDVEDTEEDDEYDEDSSESNEQGFGSQYSMASTNVFGDTITSTPVTVKATSQDGTKLPANVTTSTPVGRKLFGSEETKPAAGFNFGSSSLETKPKSESKPFTFAPTSTAATTFGSQSESSKPQTGFNFSMSGTPSFGSKPDTQSASGKPAGGLITGLFGKGKPVVAAEPETPETKPETTVTSTKPTVPFSFSTTSATSSGIFGQSQTTSATVPSFGQSTTTATSGGFFGQASSAGSHVIGQPSDAEPSSAEAANESGETTSQADTSQGDSSTGLFGQPASTSKPAGGLFGQGTASGSGLFGQSVSSSAGSTNLFGQASTTFATTSANQSSTVTTTASTGLFGQKVETTASEEAEGVATGSGLFGKPVDTTTSASTASSGGQSAASSAASSGTSLFGQSATTTTSGGGLFGQTGTTSGSGLFGQTATTVGSSLFGQPTTTTGSSTGLFGQTSGTSTAAAGSFSQTTTTTSSEALFGQTQSSGSTTTTATTGGLFGQSGGSLFGQTSTSGSGGLFGSQTTPSSGGLFGQTTTSISGGLFGQSTSSGDGGVFGQSTATTAGGGGLFGQSTATTAGGGGLFGQSTSSTAGGGGLFGQSASTTAAGVGLFGQSPATTSVGGGLFGSSSGPGFGTATSGTGFGFGQTASPAFGQTSFGQTSGFGQTTSTSSGFGQSSTDGGGGGGGMFSGLGGKPSAEKANTNVFGTAQPFGAPQSNAPGLFGSGTSQSFGNGTSTGGGFSSGGAFSGGSGVAATGFGAAKQQAGTGGFGAAPSFGSAPAFGGAPGFGNAPAFGSPPAFGSGGTQGGFGSAPAFGSPGGSTFGSVGQGVGGEGAGFAGFAASVSPTFGALAHSTDAPTFGAIGQSPNPEGFGGNTGNTFGSSPSFTGYRG